MLKRWLALSGGWRAWSWALTVLVITAVLVVLDISVGSVHCYWSRHSFTSSVPSGLPVLLLTETSKPSGPRRGWMTGSGKLRQTAVPLLQALNRDQRAAVGSDEAD